MPIRPAKPGIELLLSESTPADVPVEAWVLMPESGSYSVDAEESTARIQVVGPATVDVSSVRINEGAGRFFIQPTGIGKIKLTATCGKETATAVLESKPVKSRTEILWRFEGADGLAGIGSDYIIALSDTAKPNQQTAEIRLKNAIPEAGKGGLIIFNGFAEDFPKERIGGVAFDISTSHGFAAKNPHVRIAVVLQSAADHWIPIGTVQLSGLKEGWQSIKVPIKDHAHFESMKWLYRIRLQLETANPVNGEIFINDAGVILR